MEERLILKKLRSNRAAKEASVDPQALQEWAVDSQNQASCRKLFRIILTLHVVAQRQFPLMEQVEVAARTIPLPHPKGIMREAVETATAGITTVVAVAAAVVVIITITEAPEAAEVITDNTAVAETSKETIAEEAVVAASR
jgi:hypothetical protein